MLISPWARIDPRLRTRPQLLKDLASWFPLDDTGDGSGSNVITDVIQGGQYGGSSFGLGVPGIALAYNGNQRLGLGLGTSRVGNPNVNSSTALGVSLWAFFRTIAGHTFYNSDTNNTRGYKLTMGATGLISFQIDQAGSKTTANGATILKVNTWYLLGGSSTGTTAANGLKVWVNAVVDGTATITSIGGGGSAATDIGAGAVIVDDVRVYKRELMAKDFRAIMAEALTPSPIGATTALMRQRIPPPPSLFIEQAVKRAAYW